MRKIVGFGLVWAMAFAGGCSSSEDNPGPAASAFNCDNLMSKCPNDPPFPPELCRTLTTDPQCGAINQTWLRCVGDHQVCKADGTTDQTTSDQACAAENQAVLQCHGADGGTPD